jgi:hypothetical protein
MPVGLSSSTRISPSRLAARFGLMKKMPVALPLGWLKLETRPSATGSVATPNTIGMVEVAAFAARAAWVDPGAAITVTFRAIRSAASSGSRSSLPAAQRNSIEKSRPSTWPVSLRPFRASRSFRRGFGGGFFRQYTLFLRIPLFAWTAKTMGSAIKAIRARRGLSSVIIVAPLGPPIARHRSPRCGRNVVRATT